MLRVRDIMTRDVISLDGQAPVDMAAWRFAFEAVSGAPVRDAKGNLIGMLTQSDLVDPLRQGGDMRTVSDVMTPGAWAVHPDAPAMEAVELMLDKGIHRVLAISGPGKIAGIVTTTDVLRALVGGKFHEYPKATQPLPDDKSDQAPASEEQSELRASATS